MAGDGGAVAAHDELVVADEVELRVADVAFGDGLAGGVLLRVAEEEGSVDVSRPNALNLLAPYFFPLPAVAALLLFGLVSLAFPLVGTTAGAVAAGICGAAWGFHLCFTVNALLQRQTDLDAYGFFFSFVLVLLLNELFLFCAWVALSPARLVPSLGILRELASGSFGWFLDGLFALV